MQCPLCGAPHAACGGPIDPALEVTDVVVNIPRIVESQPNDPRDMVRVQFSERDTRSYTRMEAEKLLAGGQFPEAFIVGEQDVKGATTSGSERLSGEGATFEEAAEDLKSKAGAKAQRSSANKARSTRSTRSAPKPAESSPDGDQAETKPAETKAE